MMTRRIAALLVVFGVTCALYPLAAQQGGGAFIPGFAYDIAGAWNFSGGPTLTGGGSVVGTTATQTLTNKTLTSPVVNGQVATLAAGSLTITAAMAGRTIVATEAGVQTFTLPTAVSMCGSRLTLIAGNAGGEILVTPNAADQISIKGLVDHSTSVKPAAGTGVKNTAATNVLGDHTTLVSDCVLTWHEVAGAGIWAS